MIKKIKNIFITGVSILVIAFSINISSPLSTRALACEDGFTLKNGACVAIGDNDLPDDLSAVIKKIVNVSLFILGALSVLMLIYGGFRYTTSGGKSESIVAAKNTILYAIVGLVVAMMSLAIVNFVISAIVKSA